MKALSLALLVCFGISCRRGSDAKMFVKKEDVNTLPAYLISKVEKFSFSFNNDVPDSSALLFYYSQRFDTSFLVHFQKRAGRIFGILCQVLPAYHRGDEDFADGKDSVLFFEGYKFKIDSVRWGGILRQVNKILAIQEGPIRKEVCLDCSSYFLAYGSRIGNSYNEDRSVFEHFARYLKDSLINRYVVERQAKMQKASKSSNRS